jgi:hypothetical protein
MNIKIRLIFIIVLIIGVLGGVSFGDDFLVLEDEWVEEQKIILEFNQDIESLDEDKIFINSESDIDYYIEEENNIIEISFVEVTEVFDVDLKIEPDAVRSMDNLSLESDYNKTFSITVSGNNLTEEEAKTEKVDSLQVESSAEEIREAEETSVSLTEEKKTEDTEKLPVSSSEEKKTEDTEKPPVSSSEEKKTEDTEKLLVSSSEEEKMEEPPVSSSEEEKTKDTEEPPVSSSEEEKMEDTEKLLVSSSEEDLTEEVEKKSELPTEDKVDTEPENKDIAENSKEAFSEVKGTPVMLMTSSTPVLRGTPSGPIVDSVKPTDGSVDVSLDSDITIDFVGDIFEGADIDNIVISNGTVTYAYVHTISGSSLVLDVNDEFDHKDNISVVIPENAIKDSDENGMVSDYTFSFTTVPNYLKLVETSPEDKDIGVARDSDIIVTFDRNIVADDLGAISLKTSDGSVTYTCKSTVSGSNIIIKHTEEFPYDKNIVVIIPKNAVKDGDSIGLKEDYKFDFQIGGDLDGPSLISSLPPNGSTDISIDEDIVVTFDENIFDGINYDNILLKKGEDIVDTIVSTEDKKLIINPASDLEYNSAYTLVIPENSLGDVKGNDLSTRIDISFTTIMDTLKIMTSYPEDNQDYFNPKDEFNIVFNTTITSSAIDSILFTKKVVGNPDEAVDRIITISGNTMTISHGALEYEMDYGILIPKEALLGDGVKNLESDIEILFKTEGLPNIEPIKIVSKNIDNNKFDVEIDSNIEFVFDKSIYTTVSASSILLKSGDENIDITKTIQGNKLIIDGDLDYFKKYELTIPRNALKDNNNNNLVENIDLVFYTIRDMSKEIDEKYYYAENSQVCFDDHHKGPFDIGFKIDYFGQEYDSCHISSNGLLSFVKGHIEPFFAGPPLELAPQNNFITPFWYDLVTENFVSVGSVDNTPFAGDKWYIDLLAKKGTMDFRSWDVEYATELVNRGYLKCPAKSIYYQTIGDSPNRKFVVQWTNMYYWESPDLQMGTFQAIIYEKTNEIQLQYRTLIDADNSGLSYGKKASIGLSAPNKLKSVQFSCNKENAIEEKQAIRFYPIEKEGEITYLINDNSEYDPIYLLDKDMPGVPQEDGIIIPNGGKRVPVVFNLEWEEVEKAESYKVVVASNKSFSPASTVFEKENIEGQSIIVKNLNPGKKYYVRLFAINEYGSNVSEAVSFTTIDTNDDIKPQLISITPSGTMEVNQNLVVKFNENIMDSDKFNDIALKKGDTIVESTISINKDEIIINPKGALEYSTDYTLIIPENSISDLFDNKYDLEIRRDISTKAKYVAPPKKDKDKNTSNNVSSNDNEPKKEEKTHFEKENINTTDDKKVDKAVMDTGHAEVNLSKNDDELVLSDEILKSVFEEEDTLYVKKEEFGLVLKDHSVEMTDTTDDMDSTIEITTHIDNKKQRTDGDKLYEKGMFRVDNDNFQVEISEHSNEKPEEEHKIDKFNNLVEVKVDLNKYDLNEAQLQHLTGIRFDENPETGEQIPVKLGGVLDTKENTFTFKTDKPGEFTLGTSRNLFMVEMELDKHEGKINGKDVDTYTEPKKVAGDIMVPIRFVGEALGADVSWNQENWTVGVHGDGIDVDFDVRQGLEGYGKKAILHQSRTLVPVKMIEEEFGVSVVMTEGNSILIVK